MKLEENSVSVFVESGFSTVDYVSPMILQEYYKGVILKSEVKRTKVSGVHVQYGPYWAVVWILYKYDHYMTLVPIFVGWNGGIRLPLVQVKTRPEGSRI